MDGNDFFMQTSPRPARLLVVEDDRRAARFLEFVLKKEGYQVTLARDGEQALSIMESAKPDAMLLDLVLPGISGLDVLRELRASERNGDLVVLVLTARSFEETPEEIIMAGADSHCTKPIVPSTLLSKLVDFGVPPRIVQAAGGRRAEWRQHVLAI
ncbi:MAG TPA: response regulator [Blastocatellia bacterium]|jgi:DNA-binding response OmpR family regulator